MIPVYMYIDTTEVNEKGEYLLLPLAIADGAAELAKLAGDKRLNVLSAVYHAEKRRQDEAAGLRKYKGTTKTKYEKIMIEEDDE